MTTLVGITRAFSGAASGIERKHSNYASWPPLERASYEKSMSNFGHQYITLTAGAKRPQLLVVQAILHMPVVQSLLQHREHNHQQLPRRRADRLARSLLSLLLR